MASTIVYFRVVELIRGRDVVAYILYRMGCTHPFTVSRVAALAELSYMSLNGERLSDLVYAAGPGVFYIEGFKEMIDADACFKKHEGDPSVKRRGCIEYTCPPPSLPEEAARLLDEAI